MKQRQRKTSGTFPYIGKEQENDKQSNPYLTKMRLICQAKSGEKNAPAFIFSAESSYFHSPFLAFHFHRFVMAQLCWTLTLRG
jgi:hypothetical protein